MSPSDYWSESETERLTEIEAVQNTAQKSEPVHTPETAMEQKTDPETDQTTERLWSRRRRRSQRGYRGRKLQ